MPSVPFATFLIICPVSFFLGIIFSLFPYDYPLLWSSLPTPGTHFDAVETHLRLLHNAPNLIQRILHIMVTMGLLGLVIKLYKPSESNMLFDGGSLVLYMVAVIVYIANIIKGLRIVTEGTYGMVNLHELSEDARDNVDASGYDVDSGDSVLGREDNLKVLAASNTILALVLVGVLVLQVGQWYAERSEERAMKEYEAKEKADREKKDADATVPPPKRQGSGREGKKTK
ncbi:Protein csh3 [Exophiala dermatitidis]|uniref:ER membrane protein SH3 n=2 Tax=Exophiala dermatitidis TaxID=5970 RepID=H6BMT2_EXODN|nr:ER membrane protein SH3 [Exophiala dermatitidis NIH/UT8656]KAJ4514766.1 Protein csh3 [Exophiala dermatitidis]EHY52110.1 ER membrane protein SH3 [Exophiala dermatitidis NIH/UT8656]KAJ4518221.1 Protein csh3 [Exophiala dermatitidis]KAJ4521119.1 Protein csh3 [Exophiala dermatitidis]KAJ4547707.1 Protein csh3 [Exophiala dermatitidis]